MGLGIARNAGNMIYGRWGTAPQPEKWLFIIGCTNSGTTLLHNMLAAHPKIGSLPHEGQYLTDQLRLPQRHGLPRLWAHDPDTFYLTENSRRPVDVARIKRQWGMRFDAADACVLLEKSPPNMARTRWLQAHFDQAHFVGIVRNGYAVAEGIRRKAGHALRDAAYQWARSNEIMLGDFEWLHRKRLVRYEVLVERPDDIIEELLGFIGLSRADLALGARTWDVHERSSSVQNMNPRSFETLYRTDVETIERAAGYMLERLGYTLEVSPAHVQ